MWTRLKIFILTFLVFSIVSYANLAGAKDAWQDKSLVGETFSKDLQTMANTLNIQRLYTNIPAFDKIDTSEIEQKYPPDGRYLSDVMMVSIQFGQGMKASRKRLLIRRFGRLLTGNEIDAKGNESSNSASIIGVDRSNSAKLAKSRDEFEVNLDKGKRKEALTIVNELISSYPNDFELLLRKAQILLNLEKWSEASLFAKKSQSSLQDAMSRVQESSWFAGIQKENNLERLSMIGHVKGYLQGIYQEAQETAGEAEKGQKTNVAFLLPPFEAQLSGVNEVRIKNRNSFAVTVGLRAGKRGKDFNVAAEGIASVFIPNGKYQIFFVYSNKPDALFQGDDFTLDKNGVEIQIVKVVGGNYGIKRVK